MDVDFSGGMYGLPPLVDRYGLGLPMGHAAMVRKKESLIARICIYDHICKLHSNVSAWVSIVFFFDKKLHWHLIYFALVSLIHVWT